MKPLVIFHSPCMDGFTAAWAAWLAHPDWEFRPGVHGEPPPNVKGRKVYLLDFSYKRPVLEEMAKTANFITIIDHHKTAEADLAGLDDNFDNISTIFNMEKSGAHLAWSYFHPDTLVPSLVRYVEDRDLWRFDFDETRAICAAIFSHDYSFETWNRLREQCMTDMSRKVLIAQGEAIERKQDKDIRELLSKVQHTERIGGVTVPVANLPYQYASDAGHIMAENAPFAATYYFDGKHFKFSLRSREGGTDVSEIAKRYGGGGHKHAAGFQVQYLVNL